MYYTRRLQSTLHRGSKKRPQHMSGSDHRVVGDGPPLLVAAQGAVRNPSDEELSRREGLGRR